jgi:hypothetical protein
MAGFTTGIGNALVSGNNLDAINGMYAAQAAPSIAGYQAQAATALQNAGLVQPEMQLQAANDQSQAGYSLAGSLLAEQGIGLQQAGIAGQAGTLAQQQAIVQQENPLNSQLLANTSAGAALAGQYIGQQEQTSAQQYQEQMGAFGLQQGNLDYQLPVAQQTASGQAAAAGASNTVGAQRTQQGLQQQYGYNTGMLQNQEKQAGTQQFAAQQGYQEQAGQNALTQQSDYIQQQLGQLGQQSQAVGYQGQESQYQNQIDQLGISAKEQGLSAQQAQSQLGYQLSQLGIQGASDLNNFYGQAATADAGAASAYTAAIGQAGAATGFGAQQAISSFNPAVVGNQK